MSNFTRLYDLEVGEPTSVGPSPVVRAVRT